MLDCPLNPLLLSKYITQAVVLFAILSLAGCQSYMLKYEWGCNRDDTYGTTGWLVLYWEIYPGPGTLFTITVLAVSSTKHIMEAGPKNLPNRASYAITHYYSPSRTLSLHGLHAISLTSLSRHYDFILLDPSRRTDIMA